MDVRVLGWPEDEVTLRLDYRRFGYAGKFVVPATGKAVVRESPPDLPPVEEPLPPTLDPDDFDHEVVAAVAFSPDRTDPGTLWLRYVTVRRDRRGEGLGPRLCAHVTRLAHDRGYDRVSIAVNNPFAYEALHKAGFAWTGRETGLAELVLEHPPPEGPLAGEDAVGEEGALADPGDGHDIDSRTPTPRERYQAGLDRYRDRDRGEPERSFLAQKAGRGPPPVTVDSGN
jgi:ribosomal protein S18 acetylase RimI-like enzyme